MPKESPELDRNQLMSRQKVVIGHPHIGHGGSEARVMWLIESLKQDFDLTVVTTTGWDLPTLNALYGTHVHEDDVILRTAPIPALARGMNAAALRGACYQRFARQIAPEYDIHISAYNATDWGARAIQFIADFSWDQGLRERFDPPTPGFIYENTVFRRTYLKFSAAFGKPSGRDVFRDDVVIANSRWTAALMKQHCDVDCAELIYPPVGTEFPSVPWERKEASFVMIGRIAPEKRVERAIEILEEVRKRGHAIRFHLCGQIEHDLYGKQVAQLCHERSDWIIVEGTVRGERKADILARCRFGIQTRAAEPFGISVAEMVRAGAIVFAPDNGGQAEVLGCPDLLFTDLSDAVEKISTVLSSTAKQSELRTRLALQAEQFTAKRFMEDAHKLVSNMRSTRRSIANSGRRSKVVIGHPRLGGGGSESTTMWLIEALKQDFDVTVLTTGGLDLARLNLYYGTKFLNNEVKVRIAPVTRLFRRFSVAALRGACYQSFARRIAAEYDLRISAYNTTDWGLPAIHFIADFSWQKTLREKFDPPSLGLIYRNSILRLAYLKLAASFGSPSGRDVLQDGLIVANSHWSAQVMNQFCGTECSIVIYPPAGTDFSKVPWGKREQSFVMIGRIAPEKRIEIAIQILEKLRQRGYAVRLHLCGQIGSDRYGRQVAALCSRYSDWIVAEGDVSGKAKSDVLTKCRFGIQTRAAEPFGISVVEMIKAGAIVFAPQDGGQAEVLGRSDLLFSSIEDAVEKIVTVLKDESLQSSMRSHLARQSEQFSTRNFVGAVQTLAGEFYGTPRPDVCNSAGRRL